jgi:DNA-binding HxlR family transcriptional regulator
VPEPLDAAASVVGDRWSLLVCDALRHGPARFGDLQARVPGVSTNVLARRLRDLEAAGVVVSEPYQERPKRHRYVLTELGQGLAPALAELGQWGEQLVGAAGTAPWGEGGEPVGEGGDEDGLRWA